MKREFALKMLEVNCMYETDRSMNSKTAKLLIMTVKKRIISGNPQKKVDESLLISKKDQSAKPKRRNSSPTITRYLLPFPRSQHDEIYAYPPTHLNESFH